MNKDRVEGKTDDIKGRIKRQAGEWTGNSELQAEGTMDQAKGKAKDFAGRVEEAGREMLDKANGQADESRPVSRKDEDAA
jgi:uncharacterized protein YjbJ (UPF0337 family)